jgi:hypothetical protein
MISFRINGSILTGGPKAMFQLAEAIENQGVDIRIIYDNHDSAHIFHNWHNRHLSFAEACILAHEKTRLTHGPKEIIILTETSLSEIRLWKDSKRIWTYFLSVDNSDCARIWPIAFEAIVRRIKNIICNYSRYRDSIWSNDLKFIELALTQSFYSNEVLSNLKYLIPYYYVGDFVETAASAVPANHIQKERKSPSSRIKIGYNPKKGKISFLIAKLLNPTIDFYPVKGLAQEDLPGFFANIDAYLDFGGQPGKDRLPREAISYGCPVFVLKRGAAINGSDFPFTRLYKITYKDFITLKSILRTGINKYSPTYHSLQMANISAENETFDVRIKFLLNTVNKEAP